jgi:N4-gp56 family major capsid protein
MRTNVLPTDPQTRKAWALSVHTDSLKDQYWSKHMGPEGGQTLVIRKTDMESGPGDEVTATLTAKLRGPIIQEGQKLEGLEMRLDFATHKMRINTHRQGVNVGTAMDARRMGANLKSQGRQRLSDYIKEVYEEYCGAAITGARGVGDEFTNLPADYAGYPNALRAPDSLHLFVGTLGDKVKNTLVVGDKLTANTLKILATKARKMLGGIQDGKPVRMNKVRRAGKEMWTFVTMPEGLEDIRSDTGTQGWFEAQKALITAVGKAESDIFNGGAGYIHGTMVDEVDVLPKFTDYGSGSNINAMRSVFCGANAMAIAHGSKGMRDGLSLELKEDDNDRGNETVITFNLAMGVDKMVYTPVNGQTARDFAVIAVDHAYTLSQGATL